MKKKSYRLFFIGFILYFAQNVLLSLLTGSTSLEPIWATLFSCVIVLGIMLVIVHSKERFKYYGIRVGEKTAFNYQIHIFLFLPLLNISYILILARINFAEVLIRALFVGIMEELIFRGFLYRAIEEKSNTKKAIILSSIIFGLYHLVNVGSMPIQYVLLQVVYAMAIGIVFAIVFFATESLVLCIITHALVDVLGMACEVFNPTVEIVRTFICIMLAIYYIYMMKKVNTLKA
ncbi:MAG: CPBP family intramembrane glutamic endopeptidase [Lachnospiraceae bacterium]